MSSTTAIGRAFENHSLKFLNHHLHMALRRVGGPGDGGVDLRGWWYVPSHAKRTAPLTPPEKARLLSRPSLTFWDQDARGMRGLAGWDRRREDEYIREKGFMTENEKNAKMSGKWTRGGQEEKEVGEEGLELEEWDEWTGMKETEEDVRRLRVVVSCKAEGKALSAKHVREVEGVVAHFHGREVQKGPHQYDLTGLPLDRQPPPTVGVLCSQAGFSHNSTIRAWRSPCPMILVHIPGGRPLPFGVSTSPASDGYGEDGKGMKVVGCWWNPALSGLKGLLGGRMELRKEILQGTGTMGPDGEQVPEQWRVWYKGKRMGRVGPSLEEALYGPGARTK